MAGIKKIKETFNFFKLLLPKHDSFNSTDRKLTRKRPSSKKKKGPKKNISFHPNLNTCSNCKKPFQEVTFLTDDPPIDLIKHNENILIKDENENLKPVEIIFPISESDKCVLQSNFLAESSIDAP